MSTTESKPRVVSLTIDGRRVAAEDNSYVLGAVRQLGIDVPTLCDHPDLEPVGACRLCMVEVTHAAGITTCAQGAVVLLEPGERHAAGAPLTISIGVASFPDSAVAKDQLLDKADWAMYLAKRQGRDRVVAFATESMTPPADA